MDILTECFYALEEPYQHVITTCMSDVFHGKSGSDIIATAEFFLADNEQKELFRAIFCRWLANYNKAKRILGGD